MRVLIVGCGYIGQALGKRLVEQGHVAVGLRRHSDPQVAAALSAAGIEPVFGDFRSRDDLRQLPGPFDGVVNTAASSAGGGVDAYRQTYLEGTHSLLAWLRETPTVRYVYTGSTGVYGQSDGGWVEESSITEPASPTAKILVETEAAVLAAARENGLSAVVLRLAGIYGPDRTYWLRQFLSGRARLPGEGCRWMNMVHRDDVVGALITALKCGQPGEVYNVCDDEPVTYSTFFRWLAEALSRPVPPIADEGSATLQKRGTTNKRVSNHKLKEALGYRFERPTYREGYRELIRPAQGT